MPVYHVNSESSPTAMEQANSFLETDKPSFVLFHMNGCGPCSQTLPEWKRLENDYSDNELVGIIDVEMSKLNDVHNEKLKDGVVGFPTMRYVRNGVCENYEDCTGITPDRSYGSFKEWIAMKEKSKAKLQKRLGLGIDMLGGKKRRRSRKSRTTRRKKRTRKRGITVRRSRRGAGGRKSRKSRVSRIRRSRTARRGRMSRRRARGGSVNVKKEIGEVASVAVDGLADTAGVALVAA